MKKLYFFATLLGAIWTFQVSSQTALKSDSIDILHYNIDLDSINYTTKWIHADCQLTLTPKTSSISGIALDLLNFSINNITIEGNSVINYEYNDTLLIIPIESPINISDTITVQIEYSGFPIVEEIYNWGGFHIGTNYAYNLGVAFADNPHNYGRTWFPCIDDFIDRATYFVNVTVPENLTVVCGGELTTVGYNASGTYSYGWHLKESIPSYLASVTIADYDKISDTLIHNNDTIPIELYELSTNINKMQLSFANLKPITSNFIDMLGDYPFNKIGYCGTQVGSMEHASNISYARSAIDGTLSNEWLLAHELSHSWFGDLVTCASAEDMWLNEGWASYCEELYNEALYGKQAALEYGRARHRGVIRGADGAFFPVYGLPHHLTYGNTVYEKGACVAHTLRGYMGDSLFFASIKAYLQEFAYKHASSEDMATFLTDYSGLNINDFFDVWVFEPGFPHFSIDSIGISPSKDTYSVTIKMRQRKYHNLNFANSNRLEITFLNNDWYSDTRLAVFSGENGTVTFELDFLPQSVIIDFNEKMRDAIIDQYATISNTGLHEFSYAYFKADVVSLNDSALLYIANNWVPPINSNDSIEGLVLSKDRYYTVEGIFADDFIAKGKFLYSLGGVDQSLFTTTPDSLAILYRRTASDSWQLKNTIREGNFSQGYLIVDTLLKGEYTLALWDYDHYTGYKPIKQDEKNNKILEVYPNPANSNVQFFTSIDNAKFLTVYNQSGAIIASMNIKPQEPLLWNISTVIPGIYIGVLESRDKRIIDVEKIVISQ